ncbi:hypothetical protein NTE_02096 [Candidatus Nitrososphaera evergladensis SR1]|uniref:Uncharacterized protein n=1 Tax=Candidatus Nitrososphaera evergladensis SR1 TaxID=1459636 RepID=A0A075MRH7_9ARCH|nr:hypothetical protein [Candidatus Nitrososphaera evergladensis]AIF84151.1 hypothetical protein NTE_02096 [Candidatus Nitrososphaera evergladensis SR1]
MNRLSITLNDFLEEKLRGIQGDLIKGRKQDISFTTVVNMVLLGGILGSRYLKKDDWQAIKDFLDDQQINLDAEGLTDNYVNMTK